VCVCVCVCVEAGADPGVAPVGGEAEGASKPE